MTRTHQEIDGGGEAKTASDTELTGIAPAGAQGARLSFEEAADAVFLQYDETFRALADAS